MDTRNNKTEPESAINNTEPESAINNTEPDSTINNTTKLDSDNKEFYDEKWKMLRMIGGSNILPNFLKTQ